MINQEKNIREKYSLISLDELLNLNENDLTSVAKKLLHKEIASRKKNNNNIEKNINSKDAKVIDDEHCEVMTPKKWGTVTMIILIALSATFPFIGIILGAIALNNEEKQIQGGALFTIGIIAGAIYISAM